MTLLQRMEEARQRLGYDTDFTGFHETAVEWEPTLELRWNGAVLEQRWQGCAFVYAQGRNGQPERHKTILGDRQEWRPIPQIEDDLK